MKEEMDQRLNLFEKEQTKKFLNQINQFKNEVQQSTNETGWIDPVSKQLVINLDKARENISAETSYNIKSQESYMKPLVEETQLGSREKINTYLKKRKIVKIKESNADLISKASAAHYSTKLPIITQNKPKLQKPNQFPCYLNNQAQKPTVAKRPINAHYSQGRSSQSTQLTKPLYQNLIPKNNPLNINIIASQNHSSLQREKWAKNYILARSQNSFPQSIINQKRYVLNGTESKKPSNIQKLWAFKQLQYIESVVKM
ncbi:hypothetical protein OXYTRIMIC_240 [Oxytricha trifallax]|uniref:Uncharacterized protein n=1 Tax=Oxytricha trifallax TaxID=1172189 RepID=A0A073IBT2_9SPIT|nr:hypothetical protein OXYTRIMIC_240 [Oxytricha trifallax]